MAKYETSNLYDLGSNPRCEYIRFKKNLFKKDYGINRFTL